MRWVHPIAKWIRVFEFDRRRRLQNHHRLIPGVFDLHVMSETHNFSLRFDAVLDRDYSMLRTMQVNKTATNGIASEIKKICLIK